jgi:hypothetical protein
MSKLHTSTLAELLAAGFVVTLSKNGMSSNAPVAPATLPVEDSEVVKVISIRGAMLRQFRPLTASDRKIAQAMKLCASEGWHLWEMQYAMYCAENGVSPEFANKPTNLSAFEPINYRRFSFVKNAFLNYARTKKAGIVAKLIAM